MQGLLEDDQAAYPLDATQELSGEQKYSNNLHQAIPEECVRDLAYVDVSGRRYCLVKRMMDIVFSAVGLLMLLVPSLVIAAAVFIDDPGKIIFTQYRIGRYGKRFKLYKFRTMKMDTPRYIPTAAIQDPERHITRIGRMLRRTSIDELPQLVNVLKGDMSLVGPRPLIAEEYEIHQMRMRFGVYNIRPGLTGLAQINGRDMVSPSEKVHWDVKYLQQFCLATDTCILLNTLPKFSGDENVMEGNTDRAETEKSDLENWMHIR